MTTIQEQITHWTSERAPLVARMTEMFSTDKTLGEVEQKQYDELAERGRRHRRPDGSACACSRTGERGEGDAAGAGHRARRRRKPSSSIRVAPTVPPGTAFIRAACARIVKHGNDHEAMMCAEQRWPDMPEVALYLKAAVAPGTTTDATWAGRSRSRASSMNSSRCCGRRRRSARSRLRKRALQYEDPGADRAAARTAGWAKQKPKPVTKLAFSSVTVPMPQDGRHRRHHRRARAAVVAGGGGRRARRT